MLIKALLFDLDGTILDSVPVILDATREVCDQMGLEFDADFVRSNIGIPLEPQGVLMAGERGPEFVERYRALYENYRGLDTRLFPGADEGLLKLMDEGLRLGLVTSKSLLETSRIIEESGIARHFEVVVTADHVANHKPHPEPILKALETLGVTADEAVYVGDATFDVEAAAQAGVAMLGVSWGAGLRRDLESGSAKVVDSWQELLAWAREHYSRGA